MKLFLLTLLLLLIPSGVSARTLGPVVISPTPDSLSLVRAMGSSFVKVEIADGFGWTPQTVQSLISNGTKTLILRTADCATSASENQRLLQPYLPTISDNPQVSFYLEVGNEPEICGDSAAKYKQDALTTYDTLSPTTPKNLKFLVTGLTTLADTSVVYGDGQIAARYDAVGAHVYGNYNLSDGGNGDWLSILSYLEQHTNKPIFLTEVGINDPNTSKADKARRIVDWVNQQSSQIVGVSIFAIGDHSNFPNYEIDQTAAAVYAQATYGPDCTYYSETGFPICFGFRDYWNTHGGLFIFGYPISSEFTEDGMTVQYFERAVFEYHPNNPSEYRVLLRRLGAGAYQLRYGNERH